MISVYSSGFSSQKCFGNRKQCHENSRLWTGQRYQQYRLLQKDHKRKSTVVLWWKGGGWWWHGMFQMRDNRPSFLCPLSLFLGHTLDKLLNKHISAAFQILGVNVKQPCPQKHHQALCQELPQPKLEPGSFWIDFCPGDGQSVSLCEGDQAS